MVGWEEEKPLHAVIRKVGTDTGQCLCSLPAPSKALACSGPPPCLLSFTPGFSYSLAHRWPLGSFTVSVLLLLLQELSSLHGSHSEREI